MLLRMLLTQIFTIILIALLIQPVSAAPSPDFDESGVVDFTDFLLFVSAFGAREGQERYNAKYDLNGDGEIGFGDFLLFVSDFGRTAEFFQNAATYQQFVKDKENGREPILPDFSYSGYHYFNKPVPDVTHPVFDVTTYGAIPNDDVSDQPAIQAAIAAAEENGRGVVFFPPGEFLVNTDTDKNDEGYNEPIYIYSSNIVLRGSGSREGGTIIRMVNYMVPLPDRPGYVPRMFHFQPVSFARSTLARITESAERETFWITVNNASRLSVGQWIWVSMNTKEEEAINEFIAPLLSASGLRELFEVGLDIREEHSIAEIQGNRVRLNEPLHTHVNHAYNWGVQSLPHLEEVGVEDISFHGSFFESFVHHLNLIHNSGWSFLGFNRCVNSWVRRVSFMHVSGAIGFTVSAASSVYQVTIAGNKGHTAFNSQGSYGIWFGLSEDIAGQPPYSTAPLIDAQRNTRAIPGQHHGTGMSHVSTGNVIYRYDMSPDQPLDIHKTDPSYANLYDLVNNGRLSGSSGGGVEPHHLRRLVFWNYNHGGDVTHYDFWAGYLKFLFPIIVGFHGNPATFNESDLEVLESNGEAVAPESLFDAQLALRLGTLPVWVKDLRTEWEMIRSIPLTISRGKPSGAGLTVDSQAFSPNIYSCY